MSARGSILKFANTQSQAAGILASIQAGQLQVWCIKLLSIVADAYHLGVVIGKGGMVRAGTRTLLPDVLFVAPTSCEEVESNSAPALAVEFVSSTMPERRRSELQQRYAQAGVQEYWQVEIESAGPSFYQLNTQGRYDLITPDKGGIYFSSHEELFFPALWFQQQPDLWTMMQYWGMIQDLPDENRD